MCAKTTGNPLPPAMTQVQPGHVSVVATKRVESPLVTRTFVLFAVAYPAAGGLELRVFQRLRLEERLTFVKGFFNVQN